MAWRGKTRGRALAKAQRSQRLRGYAGLSDLGGLARKDSNERKRRNRDAILYPR